MASPNGQQKHFDTFKEMLQELSLQISKDEFQHMKMLFEEKLHGATLSEMRVPGDLFIALYRDGYIDKNNTSLLRTLLGKIGRHRLVTTYLAQYDTQTGQQSSKRKSPPSKDDDGTLQPNKKSKTGDCLDVVLLMDEWRSSKGGIPTFNRHMAINLAKLPDIRVKCCLDDFSEVEEEKAKRLGVELLRSTYTRAGELKLPTDKVDIIIGHSRFTGRYAEAVKNKMSKGTNSPVFRVHVVHMVAEQLATVKSGEGQTAENIDKQEEELKLCKSADLVIAVGPHLEDEYERELKQSGVPVQLFMPGLMDEASGTVEVASGTIDPNDIPTRYENFHVYVFGRGSMEDWEVKGFHIAAEAFSQEVIKNDQKVQLTFVGASEGKEDELKGKFIEYGMAKEQLRVRRYQSDQKALFEEIQKAELVIQPSLVDAFGLSALEAVSIGKPVLVNGTTGFGKVLADLPNGDRYVVKSTDASKWAKQIMKFRRGIPRKIHEEVEQLQSAYKRKYTWSKSCESLIEKIESIRNKQKE